MISGDFWYFKRARRESPWLQTAHSIAPETGSWEKSQIVYADKEIRLQFLLPVAAETIVIHSYKWIFFGQ